MLSDVSNYSLFTFLFFLCSNNAWNVISSLHLYYRIDFPTLWDRIALSRLLFPSLACCLPHSPHTLPSNACPVFLLVSFSSPSLSSSSFKSPCIATPSKNPSPTGPGRIPCFLLEMACIFMHLCCEYSLHFINLVVSGRSLCTS